MQVRRTLEAFKEARAGLACSAPRNGVIRFQAASFDLL